MIHPAICIFLSLCLIVLYMESEAIMWARSIPFKVGIPCVRVKPTNIFTKLYSSIYNLPGHWCRYTIGVVFFCVDFIHANYARERKFA